MNLMGFVCEDSKGAHTGSTGSMDNATDLSTAACATEQSPSFAAPRTCGNCIAARDGLASTKRTFAGVLLEQPETVASMLTCVQAQASSKQTPGTTFYCENCKRHTFLLRCAKPTAKPNNEWFCAFKQQLARSDAVQRSLAIMMKHNAPALKTLRASARRNNAAGQASRAMAATKRNKSKAAV